MNKIQFACISVVASVLALPALAGDSVDSGVYASEDGKSFSMALHALSPSTGKLADEVGVAYQGKCGAPMRLDVLKNFLTSSQGKQANDILVAQDQKMDACRAEKPNIAASRSQCLVTLDHAHYVSLVTGVACAS